MAFSVFYFPLLGTPTAEGNELTFYEAGLDVPLVVYTDSDGLIPFAQPIIFNAAGEPDGVIYVDPDGPALKVVYVDANGVAVPGYPVDNIPPGEILNVTTTSTTVLTNAQIKALPTTPITLVSAPASGLRVKPLACTLLADCTAGAYTNVNTTFASLQLQTPNGDWLSAPILNDSSLTTDVTKLTAFLNAAQARLVDLPVPYNGAVDAGSVSGTTEWPDPIIGTDPASADALALQIAIDNNGSGALTGGNAANSLTVIVYYTVESIT